MNFEFPEELDALREEARKFLAKSCPRAVPRAALDGKPGAALELWREMGRLGWIGASVPEEHGGSGLGHLAVCVLAEELGRVLAPVPYASSVYGAIEALLAGGSTAQQARHLPTLATGEHVGTLALVERPGVQDFERPATRFTDGRITGVKLAVPDAEGAQVAIVSAGSSTHGSGLFLVELDGAGITIAPVKTFDPTRPAAQITFRGAKAEPLPGLQGAAGIQRLVDRAAIMTAFEQVGGAEAALFMARDYALERYAFGRPIGSFQAIKHKLADIYVAVELARSNAYYGAWALSTDAAELPLAAAVARVAANEAGWLAAKENVQTHGGMGYTWDGDAHLFYRRAKLLGLTLGASREWKLRLMQELQSSNASTVPSAD